MEPCRARPVPFWRHGFLPPPRTSPRPFACAHGIACIRALGVQNLLHEDRVPLRAENAFGQFKRSHFFVLQIVDVGVHDYFLISISPPRAPGTAPRRNIKFFSLSISATTKFFTVTRSVPIWPAMRRPVTTRWNAVRADGTRRAMTVLLPVRLRSAGKTMPLHRTLETAALRHAAHADLFSRLERLNGRPHRPH